MKSYRFMEAWRKFRFEKLAEAHAEIDDMMRDLMTNLGINNKMSFYEYANGRHALTLAQENRIRECFAKRGYKNPFTDTEKEEEISTALDKADKVLNDYKDKEVRL